MADLKRTTWNEETWPEEMESSGYFMALVVGNFCQEARSSAQVEHARTLGLPVFVVAHKDAPVPPGFFDECDVRLWETYSDRADLKEIVRRIMEEIASIEQISS